MPDTSEKLPAIRRALLAYYDAHARDLPWRRTRDPYAIWVSEIMLQQTRVDTVLAYYDRFLARFPSAQALAAASEDEVLASWSGLGYYRRARLLHAGVRDVVARYGGKVPEDAQARGELPGVGRYTAGAIGSIAFERAEPLVDGNVARVFGRLFAIDTPPERSDTVALLWRLAEALVEGERPGALNQALMELGAMVCRKLAPRCAECPVSDQCAARALGRVDELPLARKKAAPKPVPLVAVAALAASDSGAERLLLVRGAGTLFGGLWNLPMREGRSRADAHALLCELGHPPTELSRRPVARFVHVLTHRRLEIALFSAQVEPGAARDDCRLQQPSELDALGVSRLTRKALESLRGVAPTPPPRKPRTRSVASAG
jgi:A/G-specific adenine glycosylase